MQIENEKGVYVRYVLRRFSPYFTKFFIEHGITANHVSYFSILLAIVGGFTFVFGNHYLMLIGCVFYELFTFFDCVDGEVARVTNMKTMRGLYLENISVTIYRASFLVGLTIGLHRMLGNMVFVFFGFTVALFVCSQEMVLRAGKLVTEEFGKKQKRYMFDFMKMQCAAGRVYRAAYKKVSLLFDFTNVFPIVMIILVFELLCPIKLSYTIHGVSLTVLSAYFFLFGFYWIFKTIVRGYGLLTSFTD